MSLQINGSNSLEQLAMQLSKELQRQQNDVFQPQYIVTQTQGMNNWLKIELAGKLGIVANCKFLKPNDLVSEIYFKLVTRNKQALSPAILQWVIFSLLAGKDFRDRFKKIARYYVNDDLKRMALAEKVSDLFDQYQIYRPKMVREWSDNSVPLDGEAGWQKYLWLKAKDVLGDTMPDRTVIGREIIQALRQPEQQKKLKAILPNIHVFGLSIITLYHIQIFYELAKVIDITFHLLNPAPSVYWFEDKSEKQIALWRQKSNMKYLNNVQAAGNPLLTGWGRVLQDTFSMFFETEEFLNQYSDIESPEPQNATLLGKIQNDIFHNKPTEARNELLPGDLTDGSITVNACYTRAREVEVIYNYLVHLVDTRGEALSARDIVVMVSDIDAYAPYIKAVFNAAPYKFPFTIADESFTASDNLFTALASALSLNEENFTAEQVLQLLDSKYIRTRFSITDLDLIRKVIGKANIRFGIDGKMEDETVYVSWKNGIRRIMYGICMVGEDEYVADDYTIYTLDIVEGEDAFELVRFCHFVQVLISTLHDRHHTRSITQWGEYIEQVVEKLIYHGEDNTDEDYQLLLRNLAKLYQLNELVADKVTFEVFKHSFLNSISIETRSNTFASSGITFCSLIPLRSIPFKVVALLGLNFDQFPRKETRVSFNLMEHQKIRGDRNVKENDKHLFLETILSAKEYLYISFIGRNAKDNSPLPPSILIDELIDYVQTGVKSDEINVRETMVVTHPLHRFSHKYLLQHPRLYSYLQTPETKQETVSAGSLQTEPISFTEVSLDSFISFFKNPFKAYYNNVLKIRYEQDNVLLPENEVFELDNLQAWQLKQDLLFTDGASPDYRNRGVATGSLPLKNMADWSISSIREAVVPLKEMVQECIGDATEEILQIDLALQDLNLKGRLSRIYDGKMLFISFSKNEGKYLIEAYIRYLVAIAVGNPVDLYYISSEKNALYIVGESHRSRKSAIKGLERLMSLYKIGHEEILMFYPDFNKRPDEINVLNPENFKKMVNKHLESDACDTYFRKEHSFGLFNQEDALEKYKQYSELIFSEALELVSQYYGSRPSSRS